MIKNKLKQDGNMKKVKESLETAFYILLGIILIFPAVIGLIKCIGDSLFLSKQLKKIKEAGSKISKVKDNGKKVYLFAFKSLIIKFLPNEIEDISFDGGKTYVPILESNIGTTQEIEDLRYMKYQYQTSDYRDRDMYDSTEDFIKFILKNITLDK